MRITVLAFIALIVPVSGSYAQSDTAPLVGGTGGGPFTDPCKPGDVMIGYNVTDGKAMDTFAAVCQAQNNGVLVGNNYGLRTWGKAGSVGLAGAFHGFGTPRCASGSAITQLQIWVNKFNEIDSVSGFCSALLPNTASATVLPRSAPDGGQAVSNGPSGCPAGEFATGIIGRSGALVDALGLQCSSFPWHQAGSTKPTPPAQPPTAPNFVKVIKDTDVFDRPAPPSGDVRKGILSKGTANVTLVQKGPAGWFHLSWPGNPAGNDWVYSASDFQSLDPATLGH